MGVLVAPLQQADYEGWLPLWQANMEHSVSDEATAHTWAMICNPDSQVGGLGARLMPGGRLIGICHYIVHPTTGNLRPVCYMQDLFVDPAARRQGVAKALVSELAAIGAKAGWARLYWLAESANESAQRLYQTLGVKLDFTLHVLPLA